MKYTTMSNNNQIDLVNNMLIEEEDNTKQQETTQSASPNPIKVISFSKIIYNLFNFQLIYEYHTSKIKNSIEYKFIHATTITKNGCSYRVNEINLEDVKNLNKIIKQIDPALEMMDEIIMTGVNIRFKDPSDPDQYGSYQDNSKWWLKVQIGGFGTDSKGRKSPLMNIRVARLILSWY